MAEKQVFVQNQTSLLGCFLSQKKNYLHNDIGRLEVFPELEDLGLFPIVPLLLDVRQQLQRVLLLRVALLPLNRQQTFLQYKVKKEPQKWYKSTGDGNLRTNQLKQSRRNVAKTRS